MVLSKIEKQIYNEEVEFLENFTSEHTRKSYKNDIKKFIKYLKMTSSSIDNIKKIQRKHIIKYRNYLSEFGGQNNEPSAPKSIARKLSCLSRFFDYLVEKNITTLNPVTSVKRPRRDTIKPTNALTSQQVRDLIDSIKLDSKSGHLHMALLITFFTTGLRKSEIIYLKYRDYKKNENEAYFEYIGKGGKRDQKLLHNSCIKVLDNYVNYMIKEQKRIFKPYDWLFQPTKNPKNPKDLNKPLNPKTVNEIIRKYSLKIGINFPVSPHSARATFISQLLDQGIDIYSVAQEVNHASVTTTQEYDKRRRKFKDSPVKKLDYKI